MTYINVLIITPYYKPSFVYGGPVNSISKLCEELSEDGEIHIDVYTTNGDGETNLSIGDRQEEIINNVRVKYFTRFFVKNSFFIAPSLLYSLMRDIKKYNIIHVNMWWNWVSIFSSAIAIIFGKKLIISPRGSITEYIVTHKNKRIKTIIHTLFGKAILRKAHFHLTSQIELKDTRKIIDVKKYSIIYNLLTLPKRQFAKKYNDQFTLIFLSRLHRKKGIELLLRSLAQVHISFLLKIAGDGDRNYIDELKDLVSQLKITDKVQWIGWLNNQEKFSALSSADLFVLTSYNENFANTVVESLAVSTPVLISHEVGLSEFVKESDLGWVVNLDVDEIKMAIDSIAGQHKKIAYIKENAHLIIKNTFSNKILIDQYKNMYKTISS